MIGMVYGYVVYTVPDIFSPDDGLASMESIGSKTEVVVDILEAKILVLPGGHGR